MSSESLPAFGLELIEELVRPGLWSSQTGDAPPAHGFGSGRRPYPRRAQGLCCGAGRGPEQSRLQTTPQRAATAAADGAVAAELTGTALNAVAASGVVEQCRPPPLVDGGKGHGSHGTPRRRQLVERAVGGAFRHQQFARRDGERIHDPAIVGRRDLDGADPAP